MDLPLPTASDVAVDKLGVIFNDTTNSYKFYWFLALMDALNRKVSLRLELDDLVMDMLAEVWFPLEYYKLSFGKQDGFKTIANYITARTTIDTSPRASTLKAQLHSTLNALEIKAIKSKIGVLLRWVPYRFVRPFFMAELRAVKDYEVNAKLVALCNEYFEHNHQRVVYKFDGKAIIINENWANYLIKHQLLLRGYTYWHLIRFLQKHNPNVPGLSKKIFSPDQSDRNLSDATKFWKSFLNENQHYRCIYSGSMITEENFSLDHYLPWSFVVHNQLWNLIPVPRHVNSSKSDWLPDWTYFHKFAHQQYSVYKYYFQQGKKKLLEDYFVSIIPEARLVDEEEFTYRLEQQLLPQYQIAINMGFPYPFVSGEKFG